jgi:hypothetical protein
MLENKRRGGGRGGGEGGGPAGAAEAGGVRAHVCARWPAVPLLRAGAHARIAGSAALLRSTDCAPALDRNSHTDCRNVKYYNVIEVGLGHAHSAFQPPRGARPPSRAWPRRRRSRPGRPARCSRTPPGRTAPRLRHDARGSGHSVIRRHSRCTQHAHISEERPRGSPVIGNERRDWAVE